MLTRYAKLKIALTAYLVGSQYNKALKAFSFAEKYHTGTRKNGAPELLHQIEIALFITTLKNLVNEEVAIIVALLHDVLEDYKVAPAIIEAEFGREVLDALILVSKKVLYFSDVKVCDDETFFKRMVDNPHSTIVKGVDRINNLQTMIGAFTLEKQQSYVEEAEHFFLPMLKEAMGIHTTQWLAYMNIRQTIKMQAELLKLTFHH